MCGIAGFVNDSRPEVLSGMLERIRHRGPDGSGQQVKARIGLGNVRLSIIDPSGGVQPMSDAGKRRTVVYNGELYGFKRMREQLTNDGITLKTSCDTELLLPLYETYGADMFGSLNGMFAFALHDAEHDRVVIARDHRGIKPLVYTTIGTSLYFSSEVKSFYAIPEWTATANPDAWHAFLNIRFPPSPHTLFSNVWKLPHACYMVIEPKDTPSWAAPTHECITKVDLGSRIARIHRYSARRSPSIFSGTRSEMELEWASTFESVVADHLVADVPVGIYLSAGLDSSLITSFATAKNEEVNTICLGFNEPSDENQDAALVARYCQANHTDVYLDENPLSAFRKAVYFMEEPKVNCLQGYFLAREARRHQKVVLSGLGGDELFGGYDIYQIGAWLDLVTEGPGSLACGLGGSVLRAVLHAMPGMRLDIGRRGADLMRAVHDKLDAYLILRNAWDHDKTIVDSVYTANHPFRAAHPVRSHFETSFPDTGSFAESFMRFEFDNKMIDDFLANEDRMSMAHGLESRVPFLDRRIIDLCEQMPTTWKLDRQHRKIFLRRVAQNRLPAQVLKKGKHGFTFNPVLQFQKDLKGFMSVYLSRDRVESSGVFDYAYISRLMNSRPHPSLRWHYFLLWKIAGYHLWEDVFIRNGGKCDF